VVLPHVDEYKPTDDGQPPLARAKDWLVTTDPATGQPATRETNTMPQWAGSCWYYLRYMDPRTTRALLGPERSEYWMPVDLYVGGVRARRAAPALRAVLAQGALRLRPGAHQEPFQRLFTRA
jgi:leucyl-tRNA synthetase